MSTKQSRLPILPLAVLIVGLVAIITIIVFASWYFPNSARNVGSIDQAKNLADQFMRGDPDLKVREIMEFQNNFYVIAQEKNTGINAYEFLIDRSTGNVYPEPGPNMMWNSKYGMMGTYRGTPTANMPVNNQAAFGYAQRWLDSNFPGAKAEAPSMFYGYYTIDFSLSGSIIGMLSVNGYTGEVWYHTWHGGFIVEQEYN